MTMNHASDQSVSSQNPQRRRRVMPAPADRITNTRVAWANSLARAFCLTATVIALAGCAAPAEPRFRMHVINADSRFEAAGAVDVNRDGKLDIYCAGFWYENPTWAKHFVREVPEQDGYHHTFANLPADVDGDGWTDIIDVTWHTKALFWVRNPGKSGAPFTVHDVDHPGNMETAVLADINGDGRPDVLPNVMKGGAWYEFQPDKTAPDGAKWTKHPLPAEVNGPGIGAGDINGDGLCDIVACKGWLEQGREGSLTWHGEFDLVHPGTPILVHDVDGDGDNDLVYGMAHDYGMYWMEQEQDATGRRIWTRHEIDCSWSQVHFFMLADLDNDGRQEIITGKRYRAHDTDPGVNDPKCIYYYKFDRAKRRWHRHTISEGGQAALGINTMAADLDGDGDLDLIAPGKSGLYLFENLLK